eukprot:350819-Chlamydomonas_euryale.AAC.8
MAPGGSLRAGVGVRVAQVLQEGTGSLPVAPAPRRRHVAVMHGALKHLEAMRLVALRGACKNASAYLDTAEMQRLARFAGDVVDTAEMQRLTRL